MINSTFSIFPGIGERIERHLWRMGVFTWAEFVERPHIPGFSDARKASLDEHISAAASALDAGDTGFFVPLLGPSGIWRLWDLLNKDSLCLDIETDGRSALEGTVTVAGFYSHGEYHAYVHGRNLTEAALQDELSSAKLLVTYFGGGFDVPYLKARFPGLALDIPHFDLCPAGHKVGLKGGLKKVERIVGIKRDDEVEGMSGFEAVLLWQAHREGKGGALDTLIKYNREDTVNLHTLAWIIYEKLRDATGLPVLLAEKQPGAERHPKA
jgi:uncharacterized protein YprB with RNaseH-like and TPR domain